MDICLLHIGERRIGLPMDSVREVLFHPLVSRIPAAPHFIRGVTGFRGQCLPVIDLPALLAGDSAPPSEAGPLPARSRVVVTQCPESEIGIQVDLVDQIETPEARADGASGPGELLLPLECPEEPEAQILDRGQLETFIMNHTRPVLPGTATTL